MHQLGLDYPVLLGAPLDLDCLVRPLALDYPADPLILGYLVVLDYLADLVV